MMAARPSLAGHARPGVGHSRLHATTTTSPSTTTPPLPTFPPLPAPPPAEAAVALLFKFPPLFDRAVAGARAKIVARAASLGYSFPDQVAALRGAVPDWDAALAAVETPGLVYPDYYTVPFHCYPAGNLTWDAAWEVDASARAVHAPVMDPRPSAQAVLSPDGDAALRAGISAAARGLMTSADVDPDALASAIDVGVSTGLSARELARAFPGLASITGVDLSPHMLAVAAHQTAARPLPRGVPLSLRHAAFEAGDGGGLADGGVDLVNVVLVTHECPRHVSAAFLAQAWRVLRPGGVVVVADMDPASPAFARLAANPFALAGFASSEPHLAHWVALGFASDARGPGLEEVARGMGFVGVGTAPATPRHSAMVAVKPR